MRTEEHDLQVSCVQWFDLQYRKYSERLFAIPNGGKRTIQGAVKLKKEGVRAGVPDLFLPVPSGGFHGLFIEMKSEKGATRKSQKDWLAFLRSMGYRCEVVRDFETFQDVIRGYFAENY